MLELHLHELTTPLGDRLFDVALDGIDRVRIQRPVTLYGRGALVIPHANRRARRVTEHAKRMRVYARVDAGLLRGCSRTREHVVTRTTRRKVTGQKILPAITRLHRRLQARWNLDFTEARHVTHLLCIGTELEVTNTHIGMQHIAGLNDTATTAERRIRFTAHTLTLTIHIREKPDRQP